MTELKTPVIVPDEPAPPPANTQQHQFLLYGQKQQMLPCMQVLERLVANDSWTVANAGESAKPETTSSNATTNDGNQQTVTSPQQQPSKKISVAPQLDELNQAIVTGYGVKGYIRMLGVDHSRAVCDRLYNETDSALRKLCGYEQGAVRFDDDQSEACVHIARIAASRHLHPSNQPVIDPQVDSSSEDNEARNVRDLVAYLSPGVASLRLVETITSKTCIQTVFTGPSLQTVQQNDASSNSMGERLDFQALEKSLKDEMESKSGRKTVLVIAVAGTPIFGQNDFILKLTQLRQTYGFWLHVVGTNAADLASSKPKEQLMRILRSADSASLPLGRWLGIKAMPVITFLNLPEYGGSLQQREKLECLPWWIVMNYLNVEGIQKRIDTAFRTTLGILKNLLTHPRILLPALGPQADLLSRIEKGTTSLPTVLTFKYIITRSVSNGESGGATEVVINDEYVDSLNEWLRESLSSSRHTFGLQLVDLSQCNLGAAIRYCPLEQQAAVLANPTEYVQRFGDALRSSLNILDATVIAKTRLETVLLGKYPELFLMPTKGWAGVGDLIYLPAMLRPAPLNAEESSGGEGEQTESDMEEWTEEQQRQISHFNIELVRRLRTNDRAFTLGYSTGGLRCVRLGMLADDGDMEALVDLVVKIGRENEESSQYVDSLAEVVRRGIEAANEGLRQENDERLMQEGVLRQVPVVGSFLNWFAPLPKETKARGRTFDLKTGRIISTAELLARHQSNTNETASLTPHKPATETEDALTKTDEEEQTQQEISQTESS